MLAVFPSVEIAQMSAWELSSSPLLDVALKGVIVLLIAWVAVAALRRVPASTRHAVWAGAMLGLVLLPILCAFLPAWRLAVLPPAADAPPAAVAGEPSEPVTGETAVPGVPAPVRSAPESAGVAPPVVLPDESSASEVAPATPPEPTTVADSSSPVLDPMVAVLLAWLAGAFVCLTPYLAGMVRLTRWRRTTGKCTSRVTEQAAGIRASFGVEREVPLLVSSRVSVPMVWGALRPVIFLPVEFEVWPPERRHAVLVHELAHVRRLDCLTQLLARVAVALHWFNPLAWLAERNLRLESEKACDDLVLVSGTVPSDYAGGLLEVARTLRAPTPLRVPGAAIAMARPSRLEQRLVAAALVTLLPLAALRLAAQESSASTGAGSETTRVVAADFASIQEAIDAAPEGAVVELGPGVYEEQLRIEKPLTLAGAGSSETTITAEYSLDFLQDPELMLEIQKRMQAAGNKEEQRAIRDEILEEYGAKPILRVRRVKGVVIRDLKLTLRGGVEEGRGSGAMVVSFETAGVEMSKCVVAGSPGNGITVTGDLTVEIRECLVAGVHGTGISVVLDKNSQGQVKILQSDIRNCRHRGIQIWPGGKPTIVKECRITGSAWHGIRYDHCAPLIEGNLIYDNERSGIYASGDTEAAVRGNLFYHDGIGCWSRNRDTIEGNTFVSARSEVYAGSGQGVCVLGASRPTVRKNIFFDGRVAVSFANIGSDEPDARASGKVEFQGNIFWQNDRNITWPSETGDLELPIDEEAGNRLADPEFSDPAKLDFALPEGSFGRVQGAGVVTHLPFDSPWPIQPEELRVINAREAEEREAVAATSRRSAEAKAKAWVEDLQQIQDRSKRDAAVAAILAALTSGDPAEAHAGIIAFRQTLEATYDKAPFREPILAALDIIPGDAQVAALYALRATGEDPGDYEMVLRLLENEPAPDLRRSGTHLIHTFGGGKLEGRGAELVLSFLTAEDTKEVKEAMRGLWGAEVTPAIEERLIELGKPGASTRGDAIYFGLSTLANKSPAVVEFLIETVEKQDLRNGGRALWGLGHGVPEEQHAVVADGAARILETTPNGRVRSECVGLLGRYGTTPHLTALRTLTGNDLAPEKLREEAAKAIERIQARESAE